MKRRRLLAWIAHPGRLWMATFLYTVATGVIVQLVLLPYVFPGMHAGHGLITGVDGLRFHRAALAVAETVKQSGWSQWVLRPDGQVVSGIAAIFYVLIYPEPWSVLPWNAFLNATACVALFVLVWRLIRDPVRALLAAAPFVLFPSSLLWNTQFHNENYAIPGVILLFFGWLTLLPSAELTAPRRKREVVLGLAAIAGGALLLGVVRNFVLDAMLKLFLLSSVALFVVWAAQRMEARVYAPRIALLSAACALMWLTSVTISSLQRKPAAVDAGTITDLFDSVIGQATTLQQEPGAVEGGSFSGSFNSATDQEITVRKHWHSSSWLPRSIDSEFDGLARLRRASIRLEEPGDAGIDLQVRLESVPEVLAYIPRALEIAFLAPFPSDWFTRAAKESGTAMRAVSAFEMMFVYVALLGLPGFLWARRREAGAWLIVFVCTAMLGIYAITVPNVGALYRFRYPYLMPLVTFGVAGWIGVLLPAAHLPTGGE